MDVKYVPSELVPIGKKYYQYTVIDECTRMRYIAWHDSLWTVKTVEVLKKAQDYFKFPIATVQTDNGIEFTFDYTAKLNAKHQEAKEHPLELYCEANQIKHRLIPPGVKELNGKVERSHRTDDEEFYRNIKQRIRLSKLRKKGQQWMADYNHKRAHSSLNYMTPSQFLNFRLKKIQQMECPTSV